MLSVRLIINLSHFTSNAREVLTLKSTNKDRLLVGSSIVSGVMSTVILGLTIYHNARVQNKLDEIRKDS